MVTLVPHPSTPWGTRSTVASCGKVSETTSPGPVSSQDGPALTLYPSEVTGEPSHGSASHAGTIWLHQGKVVEYGDPEDVVSSYMRYCRIESLDGELDF